MTKVWVITRYLTDIEADNLDIGNLTQEKQSSIFEAIKVRDGFRKIGIHVKIVSMDEIGKLPDISYIPRNKLPDIIVVRCMIHSQKEIMILNKFCSSGITVMNNPTAQSLCTFKSYQYNKLLNSKIPIPNTISILLFSTHNEIENTIEKGGLKYPLVVKSNCGSRADTVFKCHNLDDILESLEKIHAIYPHSRIAILQEWIDHRSNGIISVLTLGENIIGAQQRTANREIDFFISNYRKDCNRCIYDVTDELRKITLSAIKCIGNIEMSRLDIFHDGEKYLIGEVNSPGSFLSYDLFMGMDCGLMTAKYVMKKYERDNL